MKTIYKPIKFPKDGQAHDHLIEWWYFNGNLKDKKGSRYAFMDTLFKVNLAKLGIPLTRKTKFENFYFAHSIISDIENKKSYPDIHDVVVVSKDSFLKPLLFINYTDLIPADGYDNSVIEEIKPFNFKIETANLELNLESIKKPMLESGKGFTNVCGNKSFYYSLTNLKTSGRIKIGKKYAEVSGKAWMDHQWTNSVAYYRDKWNWFSIQLENDAEIMCNEYVSAKGRRDYLVDIMYPDGSHESSKKIKMTPGKIWKSRKTGQIFPLEWDIEIPERRIRLKTNAFINNQEIKTGLADYWEGPISVKGTFGGKKVKGFGFMELINNASPYGKLSPELIKNSFKDFF